MHKCDCYVEYDTFAFDSVLTHGVTAESVSQMVAKESDGSIKVENPPSPYQTGNL